jgi:hypothetical protein
MINKEEIAVCISGLARENYKFALKNIHKVFPFDTFYMHWDRGENIGVPNCLYFKELPFFEACCKKNFPFLLDYY